MEKKVNFILTSQEYFDIVQYDYQELREKIAYTLFYVTQIAQLRKDMVPKIIADRICDQYKLYIARIPLKPGEKVEFPTDRMVQDIIENNPDYFGISSGVIDLSDRKRGEIAYVLTKSKSDELMSEFNKNIRDRIEKSGRKMLFEKGWIILLLSALVFLGVYMFYPKKTTDEVKFLSTLEFAELLDFDTYNEGRRGVFFVYYVTELIGLREDITPNVVNDRIKHLGYKTITDEELRAFFEDSPYVTESHSRKGAYKMTNAGISMVKEEIISRVSDDFVKIKISSIFAWISLLGGAIGTLISLAYNVGKNIGNS